jgi:DNA repair exonuclease SbcCD ATPase subunit
MKTIKPRHIVLVLSASALIFSVYYVAFPRKFLPGEFSDARIKGANVAQRIVELSRDTLSLLGKVSKYDEQRNTVEALIAISSAITTTRDSQTEAVRLSSQLAAMAENLPRIQPARARELATEAVTAEVALVSRLIYYNTYLNALFEALRVKFERPGVDYLDGQVSDLINKINDEAQAINELNKKFAAKMAEFDQIFGE